MGLLRKLLGANITSFKDKVNTVPHNKEISLFLKKRIDSAMNALSQVIIPGYDVDLVSTGVVTRIRVRYDGSGIVVFMDYQGSNPGCSFCRFLNDNLWKRIIEDAKSRLEAAGFEETVFADSITGNPIVVLNG
jgi:metal-sulfur cluster biosynthetic enzyme